MTRSQPSTRTNSRILKGSEMNVGGSMIMPMLISVEETIRSMIRNGRKIRKPIWNAVLSSETMNAGISTSVGHFGAPVRLLGVREADEQRDVLHARLAEHEFAQRLLGAHERGGGADPVRARAVRRRPS